MNSMQKLSEVPLPSAFERKVYSQNGEDGVIEEILKRLKSKIQLDGWCVEFGAWDGKYLSNTYNLIQNMSYRAVLIEACPARYRQLCKTLPSDDVIKICSFIQIDGNNCLDSLLTTTPIPRDFDFLSIDIDGCDYHIFNSLKIYEPKLVCIEFNPTIPNHIEFIQKKDFSVKQGSSIQSLSKLGQKKGYSPVAATECNLFLLRNDIKEFVIDIDLSINQLRDDHKSKVYLFCCFDGTIFMSSKSFRLPWHGMEIKSSDIQVLPKILRKYPQDYGVVQCFLFGIHVLRTDPGKLWSYLRKKLRLQSMSSILFM